MRASGRSFLAAAIVLGAAVFAWPVQALQCARPLFWRFNLPVNEMFNGMARFAEGKVTRAQSIFKGHAINIEFIGPDAEYPAFILTFKVTEWIKGDGKPYARIIYESWCDGRCSSIVEEEDRILSEHQEKIYIADQPNAEDAKKGPFHGDIDGVFGVCSHLGRKVEPINEADINPTLSYRELLLDLAMRNAIEKLAAQPHSSP